MKKKMLFMSALLTAAACAAQYADPYKVMIPVSSDNDGSVAVLINFDNGDTVGTAVAANGYVVFEGTVDEPYAARVLLNGGRSPQFVLESGSIAFSHDGRKAFGSPLNDILNSVNDSIATLAVSFNAAPENERQAIYDSMFNLTDSVMRRNVDNPLGYILFLDLAYEMEPADLIAFIEANPSMMNYERVKKLVENNRKKAATSAGATYIDFDIEGKKLSDYVGKDGKYLIVDFFASWCGPCIRQLPVLKELYAAYPDRLNVLGVAVWDEPEASLRAIEQHELPWPCIINAGTIPTDLYGVSGIPCIMLISPEGIIINRDLQGDELKAAVEKELAEK